MINAVLSFVLAATEAEQMEYKFLPQKQSTQT